MSTMSPGFTRLDMTRSIIMSPPEAKTIWVREAPWSLASFSASTASSPSGYSLGSVSAAASARTLWSAYRGRKRFSFALSFRIRSIGNLRREASSLTGSPGL